MPPSTCTFQKLQDSMVPGALTRADRKAREEAERGGAWVSKVCPRLTHCSGGSRARSECPGWVGSAGCRSAADTVGCRNGGSAHASGWSPAASPGAYKHGTGQPEGADRKVRPESPKHAAPLGGPEIRDRPTPGHHTTTRVPCRAHFPPCAPLPCSTTAGTCFYSPHCRSPRCCHPVAR